MQKGGVNMFEGIKAAFGAVKNKLADFGGRIFSSELSTETAIGVSAGCVAIGLAALAMPIPTVAKTLIGIASFAVPVVVGLAGAAKLSVDSKPTNPVESGLDDSEDTFKQKLKKHAVDKYTKKFKKVPEENPDFIQEVLDDPVYEEVKTGLEDGSIEVGEDIEDIEDDSVEISSEDLMDLIADASGDTSVNVDIDDDDIVDMRDIKDESEDDAEPIVDMRDTTVQAREVIVDDHQNGGKTKVTFNGRNSTIDNSSPSKRTKEKLQITQKRLLESSM